MQVIEKNSLFAQVSGEQSAVVSGASSTNNAGIHQVSIGAWNTNIAAITQAPEVTTTVILGTGKRFKK